MQRLISGAKQAHALGLKVNAGHGLNYENLPALFRVPHLVELNIGHSIVSRAVIVGLETAVKEMLRADEKLSRVKSLPRLVHFGISRQVLASAPSASLLARQS